MRSRALQTLAPRVESWELSSCKQKTAYEIYQCDWSSDVCSSDLPVEALRREADLVVSSLLRQHVEQGEIMVGRRNRQGGVASQSFVGDERAVVAREQQFTRPLLETHGPVEWPDLPAAPRVGVQVMHEVAAPSDEQPFVAPDVDPLRGLVVELRRLRLVDAELDDGHVRLGEDVAEYRPRTVVESPTLI